MIEGESDEIIMELEIQWDGNPNIVLGIKTRVGVQLPIQVILPRSKNQLPSIASEIPSI